MENMVVGFPFFDFDGVYLIRKNRPEWQAGMLNGIGGHVEKGETPINAMIRECFEETGVSVENWIHVCVMKGEDFYLDVFTINLPLGTKMESKTDETIVRCYIHRLCFEHTIPNTRFLVPMCREHLDNPHSFKTAVFEY